MIYRNVRVGLYFWKQIIKFMEVSSPTSLLLNLNCSHCGKIYSPASVHTFSVCCQKPLLANYDLNKNLSRDLIDSADQSIWRYHRLLPVTNQNNIVSLHEGGTPIISLTKLATANHVHSILMKDESYNPTGSFKARGISTAVSKAKELGIERFIIPTAGNAGAALAAYCAKANFKCIVVMPEHTPSIFKDECLLYRAELILVKGFISDCAKKAEEIKNAKEYFDVSTLKEPYRIEGKKTMGYEIAEQLNWQLPDVLVYPAGGGTGLIGIWKAFNEMLTMGWIKRPLPKMMAVQSENCAPLVAIKQGTDWKERFSPLPSIANGLVVPFPFGLDLMQDVLQSSGGEVVTVNEKQIIEGIKEVAATEGILLLNTGSGYKYAALMKS
jgi:threonine synthase